MTAAYELAKSPGVQVDLFETTDRVGGMAGTFELWGQKVDFGPHRFFSSDPRVNAVWRETVGDKFAMVSRLTRIFYNHRFFYYPLRAFNALANLGLAEASRCLLSYGWEKVCPTRAGTEPSFEEWVVQRFGRRLYEIFFKTYSEKLWGIPCSELDADFAAQRIKKFSLSEAVKTMFHGNKGNRHKTLVDQFAYPLGGSGYVYSEMCRAITEKGGQVHFRSPVRRVLLNGQRAIGIELEDGKFFYADHIVSSMPITRLVEGFEGVPSAVKQAVSELRFRNTILVYLRVDAPNLFPDNWIYVHSKELRSGRITNFRNWVPSLYGDERATVVELEFWCYDNDILWKERDEELIALARRELEATGLVSGQVILEGTVRRLAWSYPVYALGYKKAVAIVQAYLRSIDGLSVIGRYGAFKYNNQDHSILMGLMAARNIVLGERNDLWGINTDYEYQESALLMKTGVV